MGFLDKIRRKDRSRSPLPSPAQASLPTRPAIVARTEPGQRIFDAAVRTLEEEEDQVAIKALLGKQDVGDVKAAQDAILLQQRLCEEKRWTTQVGACTLSLGNVAGSVSAMLGKLEPAVEVVSDVVALLKPGVDLAATIDPLHIGIPVAIVKAVLGVVVFSQDQMEKLLAGVKTAVYMLKQLSLYFEHFKQAGRTLQNYEEVLTGSYSLVFNFLVISQRALAKRGPKRAWELLWTKESVDSFEKSCDAAGVELERAASHAGRADGVAAELRKMQHLDLITQTLRGLEIKVDLSRLKSAGGAAYNYVSKDGTVYDYCLPGTRSKLIAEMVDWCHQPHQRVFWLSGMAGTGKSAVLRTVAQQIQIDGLLAASSFFRQDMAEQRDATLFVSTVCSQLITRWPILRGPVAAALDADRELPGGAFPTQFDKLLLEPLREAGLKTVLLVDALDECEPKHASIVLRQLARLAEEVDLRIIVTSRPEPEILKHFDNFAADGRRLESIPEEETEDDIRLFLKTCFDEMVKEDSKQRAPQLYAGWPKSLDEAVQQTKPLFIFAATLVRYVRADDEPDRCLAQLLRDGRQLKGMQQIYLPILRRIYADDLIKFKERVGVVLMARDPLSIEGLALLLGLSTGVMEKFLHPLRSVLQVPDSLNDPVRVLHKSFKDFLLEPGHDFWIYQDEAEDRLLDHCLVLMECKLHKNLFDVQPETGASDPRPKLSSALAYACSHWIDHLATPIGETAHKFLESHFLHWLEAMSWLDRMEAVRGLVTQCGGLAAKRPEEFAIFLYEASLFITRFQDMITLTPLQVYYAALALSPAGSLMRRMFQHEMPSAVNAKLGGEADWPALREKIQLPFKTWSPKLQFSPNDDLLAVSGESGEVLVHEVKTGVSRYFESRLSEIDGLIFSADGQCILVWMVDYQDHTSLWAVWELSGYALKDQGMFPGEMLSAVSTSGSKFHALVTGARSPGQSVDLSSYPFLARQNDDPDALDWVTEMRRLPPTAKQSCAFIYDLTTGEEMGVFDDPTSRCAIWTAELSQSASCAALVLAADENYMLWLWHLQTDMRCALDCMTSDDGVAFSPAFSQNERFLAYARDDSVRLWDVSRSQLVWSRDSAGGLRNLCFLKDDETMFYRASKSSFLVPTGTKGLEGGLLLDPELAVAWSHDAAATLVRHDRENYVYIQDIFQSIGTPKETPAVDAIVLSADGQLAAVTIGTVVQLWVTATGTMTTEAPIDYDSVPGYGPTAEYPLFAVGLPLAAGLGTVFLCHLVVSKRAWQFGDECFALSKDETILAMELYGTVLLYHTATGLPFQQMRVRHPVDPSSVFSNATFSPHSKFIYLDDWQILIDGYSDEQHEYEIPRLSFDNGWIRLREKRMLLVGEDRAGRCSAATKRTLVIGHKSGLIDFYTDGEDEDVFIATPTKKIDASWEDCFGWQYGRGIAMA